jgi:hypothetical protein
VAVREARLVPVMCISLSMPLEKFDQVPTLSHAKFSHSEWQHLRELWRQGKLAVGPKRFSCFLNCDLSEVRLWHMGLYFLGCQLVWRRISHGLQGRLATIEVGTEQLLLKWVLLLCDH